MSSPKVTIIITCFNHEPYVIRSIKSAINQSYLNVKIIVIDDYSTDRSREVIENFLLKYPEITFIKNEKNLGHNQSFNQILSFCESDYIMDLSGDDYLNENCIENLVKAYKKLNNDNYFVVYSNCNLVDHLGNFIKQYYPDNFKNLIDEDGYCAILSAENKMCSVTALLNYKIFLTLNGYDPSLAYEDLDYWIRALRKFKIKYIDEILVNKSVLENSLYSRGFTRNYLTKHFNNSTVKILFNAYHLNKYKQEDYSLLKRVHFEMVKNFKVYDFINCIKLSYLELKCRFRKF